MRSAFENVNRTFEAFRPAIESLWKQIKISLELLPENLKIMANHGWFINMHMTPGETNYAGELLKKGHFRKADNFMVEMITNYQHLVKRDLFERHPKRSKILKAAFRNHQQKDYISSIPIFLAQADGICFDYTNLRIYRSQKGKPEIRQAIKKMNQSSFRAVLLQPLLEQTLITASENRLNEFRGNLNRHEILHGVSVDYPSRINSCKAISWIAYISELFEKVSESID